MPELPEVETMRRGLLGIVGNQITAVEKLRCPRKPILSTPAIGRFRQRAVGQTITAVDRIAKRVLVRLESDDAIVLEPRMTGLALLSDPPDPLYLRFRFDLKGGCSSSFWYWDRRGLGNVKLMTPEEQTATFHSGKLGPDALVVTGEALRERLGKSRRAVKVALLDQRAVAGIGNLYAAEILHQAGIHPEVHCERLTLPKWSAIAEATHEILSEAIKYEGSTLGDGTYRNALNKDGSYQNKHRVYGRAGQPCGECGREIERIVQAQRSTFFCPRCQRKR